MQSLRISDVIDWAKGFASDAVVKSFTGDSAKT